jgi:hypothetical protein
VADSCEHVNEHSGSIKGGELVELLLLSQEGLCSMKLIGYLFRMV